MSASNLFHLGGLDPDSADPDLCGGITDHLQIGLIGLHDVAVHIHTYKTIQDALIKTAVFLFRQLQGPYRPLARSHVHRNAPNSGGAPSAVIGICTCRRSIQLLDVVILSWITMGPAVKPAGHRRSFSRHLRVIVLRWFCPGNPPAEGFPEVPVGKDQMSRLSLMKTAAGRWSIKVEKRCSLSAKAASASLRPVISSMMPSTKYRH